MKNENVKRVIMGADRYGYDLKNAIRDHLLAQGYDVVDVNPDAPILFQDAACKVSQGIQSGECDRGIAICGSGMGVSIICNKHKGVYAALCESVTTARRSKQVNNTNVLCMGGFYIGHELGRLMADAWLEQNLCEGLDPEMAAIVGKEYLELVEFEKEQH